MEWADDFLPFLPDCLDGVFASLAVFIGMTEALAICVTGIGIAEFGDLLDNFTELQASVLHWIALQKPIKAVKRKITESLGMF